jgi:Na+/H+ antiporter NhaC
VIGALADTDHMSILVFSLMLGGMVGVVSRSGGTVGLVETLARRARTSRDGQLTTWILGIAIFFDDYANTLVVGNAMRPVTDRLRVSREKLAYIVDSTAAPVAAIALITTWIGAEVSYIAGALDDIGSDLDAYVVFLQSIPYNFYPILALVFGFSIAFTRRDFGPMLRAERRALSGQVMREGAQPLSDFDSASLRAVEGRPHRWFNAVVPVLTVIIVTMIAQWSTGRAALTASGDPQGVAGWTDLGLRGFGNVFSAGNSYHALLWASFSGCVVALGLAILQRILTLAEGLDAWTQGVKSMMFAMVILALAWSIASVCDDLSSAAFVAEFLSGTIDARLFPALVFVMSALIAFATGTSWGTMGLLIPLALPAAFRLAQETGLDASTAHGVFLGATAAVLSGAIFGDHCSPISDTTVLSSMSSGCDHVDHVRTQLPYALCVGTVAIVLGYLPEAVGLSPWWSLALGAIALILIVRFVGRPVATAT